MSEENKSESVNSKSDIARFGKTHKIGYVVSICNYAGDIVDTPFATFDRGLAEEMCLTYAWEEMYKQWYLAVHKGGKPAVSAIYEYELTDFNVCVKEINWYE